MSRIQTIIFILLFTLPLFSQEVYEIHLGGESGFSNLYLTYNLSEHTNRMGYDSFRIKKRENIYSPSVDLLLSFEGNFNDLSAKHEVIPEGEFRFIGYKDSSTSALYFPRTSAVVYLKPEKSFFNNSEFIGSFTIEFVLNPASHFVNAVVFSKYGNYIEDGKVKTQGIRASLVEGKMVWEFKEFFHASGKSIDATLSKGSFIEKGVFHHHSISFDSETGKLVKYLDGVEEEIVFVTEDGTPDSTIYQPYFSKENRVSPRLGGGFVGFMDEVVIRGEYKDSFDLHDYSRFPAEMVSRVIDFRSYSAFLKSIKLSYTAEGGSDARLFYRAGKRFFLPSSPSEGDLQWIYIPNDYEFTEPIKASYVQTKVILKTDPSMKHSPQIDDIIIEYEENGRPLIPTGLMATPANSSVILSWDKTSEADVKGYKIYFGRKKGIYDEEDSPIIVEGDANRYIITSLENETLYYFTISAYDGLGPKHEGGFAEEVYARPKSYYTNYAFKR